MYRNLNPGALGIVADLEATAQLAQTHGWPAIDLPMHEAYALATTTSAETVAEIASTHGLRYGGWGLPINWRKPYDQDALATLAAQAKLAAAVGCTRAITVVLPFSEDLPFREHYAFHLAQLRPVADILGEHGCQLGIEFIGPHTLRGDKRYGFISSLDGALALSYALGEHVGLLLDAWHWYTSGGDLADLRALSARDVVYVHVNDAPAGLTVDEQIDNVRRLPATTGVIDIAGFMGTLKTIGYDGPVTPEPFEERLRSMLTEDALREAGDSMTQIGV